jgi:hypothetical protein
MTQVAAICASADYSNCEEVSLRRREAEVSRTGAVEAEESTELDDARLFRLCCLNEEEELAS